jgi:acyl-CoA synthetase (AMP-forming)/AMP-acid ligase II
MIINGGSSIYLRELEEVLLRHPDLVEASVVRRPHPDWGEKSSRVRVLPSGSPARRAGCFRVVALTDVIIFTLKTTFCNLGRPLFPAGARFPSDLRWRR